MKIIKDEIEHIAPLARLSLSEEEKEMFGSQLSKILDYMEKLNETMAGIAKAVTKKAEQ